MPLAQIYTQFANQIVNLQEQATNVSQSIRGLAQRRWRVPYGMTTGSFDIEGYDAPFARSQMNAAYPNFFVAPSSSTSNAGTVNDAAATKWQACHLGGQERALRLQSNSGIRCATHAAARRTGHGDAQNGSFARIVDHIIDMIVEGGS